MLQTKRFARRREDFVCARCGAAVTGAGYRNHCPKCLYSRHVDVNPGDRAEGCQGLMAPVAVEVEGGRYVLVHECERCKAVRRNKAAPDDDTAAILRVARARAGRG